jgi:hypothetical protein
MTSSGPDIKNIGAATTGKESWSVSCAVVMEIVFIKVTKVIYDVCTLV